MKKILGYIFLIFVSPKLMAQKTVRFEIKSFPVYHAAGSSIYLAGTFNGWHPQDDNYKFKKGDQGNYSLEINLDPGIYEYKITRGGWDKAECKIGGTATENRNLKVDDNDEEPVQVELIIEEWQDRFPPEQKPTTISKNVFVLDTAFLIPQLKRTRRIWIYLPEDYTDAKNKKYPVLYMQDGQNIFDDATSYSGEWGVDEFLDSTKEKPAIVVAVDHAGVKRMNEYNPYDNIRFGKGEGDKYIEFLVKTLKPFIDKNYRTLKEKENTIIAGSSMGGLISMYALLKYPDIFGGAGVFSPSFWITGSKIFEDISTLGSQVHSKIYFYCGKNEKEKMRADMLKVVEEMKFVSKSKMKTVISKDGKHNEITWRKEFPSFYKWIFSGFNK